MKETEKKKPVNTIPDGVWEATHGDEQKKKSQESSTPSTDLQGNGYPKNKK